MGVKEIHTVEEFDAALEAAPKAALVAVNFYTEWAAPCAQMNQ
jgi:hypothetical protein